MEKLNAHSEALLKWVKEAARLDGIDVHWRPDGSAVSLRWDDGPVIERPLTVLPGLTSRTCGPVLAMAERSSLVVTEHVSATMSQRLRAEGFAYLDAGGNAYVRDRRVLLDVRGRNAKARPRPTPLFTKAAVPVLLCVLNQPDLIHAPVRALAERTPVSLGTAQNVKKALVNRLGRDVDPPLGSSLGELEFEWSMYYLDVYRPMLDAQRYSTSLNSGAFRDALGTVPVTLSGEYAARQLGYDLVPASGDFYVEPAELAAVRRGLRLRRDSDGPVTLRTLFWNQELLAADRGEPGSRIAPKAVVWSDLGAIDDPRVWDVARQIGGMA